MSKESRSKDFEKNASSLSLDPDRSSDLDPQPGARPISSEHIVAGKEKRGAHFPFSLFSAERIFRTLGNPLSLMRKGEITLVLPSGHKRSFKGAETGRSATIIIKNYMAIWKLISGGWNGFAEGYMDGDWDTEDLTELFLLYLDNRDHFESSNMRVFRGRWRDNLFHHRHRNSRKGSRRNIAYHYDLGNEFYKLWLDPSMTYSSAYFDEQDLDMDVNASRDEAQHLERAQRKKYQRVLELADLSEGADILEIGCGWGGFAERAALEQHHNVTGLTLSQEQLAYAVERAHKTQFAHHADFKLRDYRDERGQYDAIVSIEMIEAVGREHWPVYFSQIYDRLKVGGVAVIQAITIAEQYYEAYCKQPDFIQRYIFPGGMLPTVDLIKQHTKKAGLNFESAEWFRLSYAKTLRIWRKRFQDKWPQIEALGFDERFKRMWVYYLAYCEAGFAEGSTNVGLYVLRKPA